MILLDDTLKKSLFIIFIILNGSTCAETLIRVRYTTGLSPKKYQITKGNFKKDNLELGDTVKSLIVKGQGKYKVYQQTETSVTVMDEGPHQDLTDWKHGRSSFVELSNSNGEYLFIDQSKEVKFPKVELFELVNETKRLGGDRWADIAKKCKSPNEYPCGVSPSKFIFKIKKEVKGKWIDQGQLILLPPMGC